MKIKKASNWKWLYLIPVILTLLGAVYLYMLALDFRKAESNIIYEYNKTSAQIVEESINDFVLRDGDWNVYRESYVASMAHSAELLDCKPEIVAVLGDKDLNVINDRNENKPNPFDDPAIREQVLNSKSGEIYSNYGKGSELKFSSSPIRYYFTWIPAGQEDQFLLLVGSTEDAANQSFNRILVILSQTMVGVFIIEFVMVDQIKRAKKTRQGNGKR